MKLLNTDWRAALAAAALALAAPAAHATTIVDGLGLLGTYTGDQNVPDLDVVSASAQHTAHGVTLSATMAGNIGTTADGIYVWGVNRGAGTPLLTDGHGLTNTDHPIGDHIPFDAFIRIDNHGAADLFLLTPGPNPTLAAPPKRLDTLATITGATISLFVSFDDLPGQGFGKYNYGYNIWPRNGDISTNDHVTDLAPDNSNFRASGTPEPGVWALMLTGFGLTGAAVRRRRRALAA